MTFGLTGVEISAICGAFMMSRIGWITVCMLCRRQGRRAGRTRVRVGYAHPSESLLRDDAHRTRAGAGGLILPRADLAAFRRQA